jgi:hypothetical protein
VKKRLLLATMASIALFAGEARAQIDFSGGLAGPGTVVFDPTAVGQLLEQVGVSQEQLTQLVTTYQEIVQVYGMATKIWNSVNEVVGANQWAPGLLDGGIRNPLPFAAAASPGWIAGLNDPSTLPYGAQYLGQATVGGDPTVYNDGTFPGAELLKEVIPSLRSRPSPRTIWLRSRHALLHSVNFSTSWPPSARCRRQTAFQPVSTANSTMPRLSKSRLSKRWRPPSCKSPSASPRNANGNTRTRALASRTPVAV